MANSRFSLAGYPWLFLLVFYVALVICLVLMAVVVPGVFKLPRDAPATGIWQNVPAQALLLFVVVPFLMGVHDRSRPYSAYLSEIRLTHVQPLLQLILLGLSCYLLLALSQVAGALVYRLSQGGGVDMAFIRSAFPITSELPPRSAGWFLSLPSIFEEIAFRGVILALFLRFYNGPKAIVISALAFGAVHVLNLISGGHEPVWVAGQVVWAAILGLFYGYVTLKTGSLLPAMLVHYLGNLFISSLTGYMQNNAPVPVQALYGIVFSFGVIPTVLMSLWVRGFTSWWPMTPKTWPITPR